MSPPARSSLGLDAVSVRYSHFRVEIFLQLTAIPKRTSISIKIGLGICWCMIYKTAYSLRQSLAPITKTAALSTVTNRLYTLLFFSLRTFLNVTSREFLAREQCVDVIIIWNLYSTAAMNKDTGIYFYWTENNILRLYFHSSYHIVFWLSFYKTKNIWICVTRFKKSATSVPLPT